METRPIPKILSTTDETMSQAKKCWIEQSISESKQTYWFHICTDEKNGSNQVDQLLRCRNLSKSKYAIYYHATIFSSAENIVREGIQLESGRKRLDFSRKPAFYMTSRLQQAVEWSTRNQKRWGNLRAIVIFAVPNHLLSSENHYELTVEKMSEWQEHVWCCRTDIPTKRHSEREDKYQAFSGPVLKRSTLTVKYGPESKPMSV